MDLYCDCETHTLFICFAYIIKIKKKKTFHENFVSFLPFLSYLLYPANLRYPARLLENLGQTWPDVRGCTVV